MGHGNWWMSLRNEASGLDVTIPNHLGRGGEGGLARCERGKIDGRLRIRNVTA